MEPATQEIISPSPITLGQVLTRVRAEELNLSQDACARFLGINRGTLSLWERDKVIPNRANLARTRKKLLPYLTPEELVIFENGPEKIIKSTEPEAN